MQRSRPTGFGGFLVIWFGQLVSALGTRMTNFALSLWVWQETGSAIAMSLLLFSAYATTVLCSPLAGALVDRLPRKLTIVLSDVGAAAITAMMLLILVTTGSLPIWLVLIANGLIGAFLAFQYPAYASAITLMMQRGNYPRANALMAMVRSVPAVFAPAVAGAVLALTGIEAILLVDVISCLIATLAVFLIAIPTPERSEPAGGWGQLWQDCVFGFRYLLRVRDLLKMEAVLFATGALAAIGWTLLNPLLLTRTGSEGQTGLVQSIGAIGGVAAGALMGILSHRGRKMWRVLLAIIVLGVLGRALLGVGDTLLIWSVSVFMAWFSVPFLNGYAQAIWQEKIKPAVQGRVFSAQQFIEELATPIGLGTAGILADTVFEPAMRPDGALAPIFGGLVGTGPGAGMALLFVLTGVGCAVVGVIGFLVPAIRQIESRVPDHEESEQDRAVATSTS